MKPLVLALLPRPPHPTRDGGAIRMRHLLGGLAEEFRIRAFVLRTGGAPDGDYPGGVDVVDVPWERNRAAALLLGVLTARSHPEALYRSTDLAARISRAIAVERPAWILAHSYQLGPAALAAGPPAWIDFQNVDSEIWARMGETSSSRAARVFARLQAPRVAAFEARLVRAAAGVSCVSERDGRALSSHASAGAAPLVVPNGVDLDRYAFRDAPAPDPIVFFVGDLSWPPNADGLRWFRDEIWPRIRRRSPSAQAEILGRGAPADLARRASDGVRLFGEGGDTRPFWRRGAVSVVPLLAGGGTRLKILESAACGVPVVSTSVGAEGLDLTPGEEIAIADDPESFAAEVSALLADPARRARLARAARRRIEDRYGWGGIASAFARELFRRSHAS